MNLNLRRRHSAYDQQIRQHVQFSLLLRKPAAGRQASKLCRKLLWALSSSGGEYPALFSLRSRLLQPGRLLSPRPESDAWLSTLEDYDTNKTAGTPVKSFGWNGHPYVSPRPAARNECDTSCPWRVSENPHPQTR